MFYTFEQKLNTEDYQFSRNLGIGKIIIIEADTHEQAKEKIYKIASSFSDIEILCECCQVGKHFIGVQDWFFYQDEATQPLLFGFSVTDTKYISNGGNCFVHYADGNIKFFEFKNCNCYPTKQEILIERYKKHFKEYPNELEQFLEDNPRLTRLFS